jgi:Uma2 family endonuclease
MAHSLRREETRPVPLTFDQWVAMSDAGQLKGYSAHTELLDGELHDLAPISSDHWEGQGKVVEQLRRLVRLAGREHDLVAGGSGTLRLNDRRGVEPDGMVLRRAPGRFAAAENCLLAVEYAVTSQHRDLEIKPGPYAEASVPEYWVVDRRSQLLHVFRRPENGSYADRKAPLGPSQTIAPLFAPDLVIYVADLL